jgi:hypothetical protein
MTFDSYQVTHRLSHQVSFHIKVQTMGKNIILTVIDEGASTCIMFISCWKAISSLKLNTSATLLKASDGHMFQPHGIISALPIDLGGKTIYVDVEVVDAPLEYNLLLERTWFYKMTAILSSVFRVIRIPHQGKIVMIDQLTLCTRDLGSNAGSNVPFVGNTQQSYMNVGVGMFKDHGSHGFHRKAKG